MERSATVRAERLPVVPSRSVFDLAVRYYYYHLATTGTEPHDFHEHPCLPNLKAALETRLDYEHSNSLNAPLLVFAQTRAALFGWERARDIVTLSNPPGEGCSESPSKWLFVGHSAGTIAIENVSTQARYGGQYGER